MTSEGERPGFLPQIESVRGVAAFCVAFGHTVGFMTTLATAPWLLAGGWVGLALAQFVLHMVNPSTAVILFFVISGLVLGRSLDGRGDGASKGGYFGFLWRRVWRIYPAHIGALAFVLAASAVIRPVPIDLKAVPALIEGAIGRYATGAAIDHFSLRALAANLSLRSVWMNPVTWSLRVEMAMSVLLPAFHIFARQSSGAFNGLALAAFTGATIFLDPQSHEPAFFSLFIPAFYLGLLIPQWGQRWSGWMVRFSGGPDVALMISWLALMAPGWILPLRPGFVNDIEALGGFSLLSVLVFAPPGRGIRFLNHAAVRLFGRVSFSFYLFHPMVLGLMFRFLWLNISFEDFLRFNLPLQVIIQVASIGAAFLISILSYRFVETPSLRLGRRVWSRLAATT